MHICYDLLIFMFIMKCQNPYLSSKPLRWSRVSKSSCPSSLGISEHGNVNEMNDGDISILLSRGDRMSTVQLEKRRQCKLQVHIFMLILGICVVSLQTG